MFRVWGTSEGVRKSLDEFKEESEASTYIGIEEMQLQDEKVDFEIEEITNKTVAKLITTNMRDLRESILECGESMPKQVSDAYIAVRSAQEKGLISKEDRGKLEDEIRDGSQEFSDTCLCSARYLFGKKLFREKVRRKL